MDGERPVLLVDRVDNAIHAVCRRIVRLEQVALLRYGAWIQCIDLNLEAAFICPAVVEEILRQPVDGVAVVRSLDGAAFDAEAGELCFQADAERLCLQTVLAQPPAHLFGHVQEIHAQQFAAACIWWNDLAVPQRFPRRHVLFHRGGIARLRHQLQATPWIAKTLSYRADGDVLHLPARRHASGFEERTDAIADPAQVGDRHTGEPRLRSHGAITPSPSGFCCSAAYLAVVLSPLMPTEQSKPEARKIVCLIRPSIA